MTQKPPESMVHLLGTPITAEPSALISPVVVFTVGTLTSSQTSWPKRLRSGAFTVMAYHLVEIIHTIGHIISSRKANAPMDEIHMVAPMPRTVYYNEDIPPESHIMRAVGGPIISWATLILGLLLRCLISPKLALHEFLGRFNLINFGISLASLFPLPFVDGGSMLKWRLVQDNRTPDAAEAMVDEANLLLGGFCGIIGLIFLPFRFWKTALLFLLQGALFIASGLGKIR